MESRRNAVSLQDRKDLAMNKRVSKQIKSLQLGQPVEVFWFDASKGEARFSAEAKSSVQFDIPVRSLGYFIGVAGEKTKHLILVRDHFLLNKEMDVHDVDFSSIPTGMIHAIRCPEKLNVNLAKLLQKALLKIRIRKQRGRKILRFTEEEHE